MGTGIAVFRGMNLGAVLSISLILSFLAQSQAAEIDFQGKSAPGGAGRKMRVSKLPMETDSEELKSLIRLATHPDFLNLSQAIQPHAVLLAPRQVESQAIPHEKAATVLSKVLPLEPASPRFTVRKSTVVDHYERKQITVDVPVYKTWEERVEEQNDASAYDAE